MVGGGGKTVHYLLSTLSCQSFFSRVVPYLSLINFRLLQADGEHQEHRHRF
jgi:hypothetical protein